MKLKSPPWICPLFKRIMSNPKHALQMFSRLSTCGDIVRLPTLQPRFLVNDPEIVQHILLHNFKNYTKDAPMFNRAARIIGDGLLTNSGEKWSVRREQLQSSFHTHHLETWSSVVTEYTFDLIKKWEQFAKKGSPIDISRDTPALALNIAAAALFGIDIRDKTDDLIDQIRFVNGYAAKAITLKPFLTPGNLRYQKIMKSIDQKVSDLIQEARQFPSHKKPLLANLLCDETLKDNEILSEIKNFFLAGHETTGNAISWTLYNLCRNPNALQTLQNEISSVLSHRTPTFGDLPHLKYTQMTIEESIRLFPPVWIIDRYSIEKDQLGKYYIPPKASLFICTYLMHRHPKYWENPEEFCPERFASENRRHDPKCVYLPFGSGPRVCIGKQLAMMNMKLIISLLLQHFDFELVDEKPVEVLPLITLKPKNGIWMRCYKTQ